MWLLTKCLLSGYLIASSYVIRYVQTKLEQFSHSFQDGLQERRSFTELVVELRISYTATLCDMSFGIYDIQCLLTLYTIGHILYREQERLGRSKPGQDTLIIDNPFNPFNWPNNKNSKK